MDNRIIVEVYQGTGNHGCRDGLAMEFAGPFARVGKVVDAYGCSSCWQVGHDGAHSRGMEALVGRTVRLIGMRAGAFARHIARLDDEGQGRLAEDRKICTRHWVLSDC